MMYTEEQFKATVTQAIKMRLGDLMMASIFEGYKHLGEDECGRLLQEKIGLHTDWDLDIDDICFYWEAINEAMKRSGAEVTLEDKARETILAYFMDEGLELGKDFSFEGKGVYLTDEAMEVLKNTVPPEVYEYLQETSYQETWSLQSIEQNIGLPGYFDRMIRVVQDRMDMYCEAKEFKLAADYLWYLLEGTIKRFPMLEDCDDDFSAYLFGAVVKPEYRDVILDFACETQNNGLDEYVGDVVMSDLIDATGIRNPLEELSVEERGVQVRMYTKADLKALNLVWEALGEIPIRELIAQLELRDQRKKRGLL